MMHPISGSIVDFFDGVHLIVKLDSDYEGDELYRRHSENSETSYLFQGKKLEYPRYKWKESCLGKIFEIGTLNKRPVTINVYVHQINDCKVAFLTNQGQLVDFKMIDDFVDKLKIKSCSFQGFHHAINNLRLRKTSEE